MLVSNSKLELKKIRIHIKRFNSLEKYNNLKVYKPNKTSKYIGNINRTTEKQLTVIIVNFWHTSLSFLQKLIRRLNKETNKYKKFE